MHEVTSETVSRIELGVKPARLGGQKKFNYRGVNVELRCGPSVLQSILTVKSQVTVPQPFRSTCFVQM